jgi:Zn-dependent membrane protease YugP
VNAVLDAAALTYVAAAAQAITQLLYFLTVMNRRNS